MGRFEAGEWGNPVGWGGSLLFTHGIPSSPIFAPEKALDGRSSTQEWRAARQADM
jgi:hypothetical protein